MKNILVLFLSTVKVGENGVVVETDYNDVGPTHTTNESAFIYLNNYLKEKGENIDYIFIFASDLVRKNIKYIVNNKEKEWKNEFGNSESHLEYFKKSICVKYSILREKMIDIDYDEFASPNDMTPLLTSINKINSLANNRTQDVTIHVDMTGGMRHTSMLMVALMRLLQFRKYNIGKVMYSNLGKREVEEAKKIYSIFDLVNGANEFTNYGSATEFLRYITSLKGETSHELRDLINNIKDFSEEIKLCHKGKLLEVSKKLANSIINFDKKLEKEMESAEVKQNDKLVKVLMPVFKGKYNFILKENMDDLDLIEWCVENEYIQQALTVYNESIPDVIMERGILSVADEYVNDMARKYKEYYKPSRPIGYNYYIIGICSWELTEADKKKEVEAKTQLSEDMTNIIRSAFRIGHNTNRILCDNIAIPARVKEDVFNKYKEKILREIANVDSGNTKGNDVVDKLSKAMGSFKNCDKKIFCELINNRNLSNTTILKAFGIDINSLYKRNESTNSDEVLNMYHQNVLVSDLNEQDIKIVLENYFWLQNERNGANHARMKNIVADLEEIKKRFRESIEHLRKCCDCVKEKQNGKAN